MIGAGVGAGLVGVTFGSRSAGAGCLPIYVGGGGKGRGSVGTRAGLESGCLLSIYMGLIGIMGGKWWRNVYI